MKPNSKLLSWSICCCFYLWRSSSINADYIWFYKHKNNNSWRTSSFWVFSAFASSLSTLRILVCPYGRGFSLEACSLIHHHLKKLWSSSIQKLNVRSLLCLWKTLVKASKRLPVNQSPSRHRLQWQTTKPLFKDVLSIQLNSNRISHTFLTDQILLLDQMFHLILNQFWLLFCIQTYFFMKI